VPWHFGRQLSGSAGLGGGGPPQHESRNVPMPDVRDL